MTEKEIKNKLTVVYSKTEKCCFQDCNKIGTEKIRFTIGNDVTIVERPVCKFHFNLINEQFAYKPVSFEVRSDGRS